LCPRNSGTEITTYGRASLFPQENVESLATKNAHSYPLPGCGFCIDTWEAAGSRTDSKGIRGVGLEGAFDRFRRPRHCADDQGSSATGFESPLCFVLTGPTFGLPFSRLSRCQSRYSDFFSNAFERQRCDGKRELLLEPRHFSCARADDTFVMGSGRGVTISTPRQALITAYQHREDVGRKETATVLLVGPGSGEPSRMTRACHLWM